MTFRWWQIPAALTALGLNLVFGAANLSFMTRQAAGGGADYWQFAAIAVVIELGLISAPFAMARWSGERRWLRLASAALVWVVCVGLSAHSLHGWMRANFAAGSAGVTQAAEGKARIEADLMAARAHLAAANRELLGKLSEARRDALERERTQSVADVERLDTKLGGMRTETRAEPMAGFDTAATLALVLLNSVSWFAFFGDGRAPAAHAHGQTARGGQSAQDGFGRDAHRELPDDATMDDAQGVGAAPGQTAHPGQLLIALNNPGDGCELEAARARRDAQILHMAAQGLSQVVIARETGVDRRTVGRVIGRAGAQAGPKTAEA